MDRTPELPHIGPVTFGGVENRVRGDGMGKRLRCLDAFWIRSGLAHGNPFQAG